jgi:hypothetical protein
MWRSIPAPPPPTRCRSPETGRRLVTLPAGQLRDALGIREVSYTKGQQALALKEQKLQ